jgi:hypothetical protein
VEAVFTIGLPTVETIVDQDKMAAALVALGCIQVALMRRMMAKGLLSKSEALLILKNAMQELPPDALIAAGSLFDNIAAGLA